MTSKNIVVSALSRRSFLSRISRFVAGASIVATFRPLVSAAATRVREKFKGTAYYRGNEAYEKKRASLVWQGIKPQRYPNCIYEVKSEEDILSALAEARAAKLPVSIVCGGHSYVANGVQEGTILLDISRLRDVEIDVTNRVARIQPGIRSVEFDLLLQEKNLAFPVAHSPTVALGGFLLGGGMGWNAESWNGLACFNIRAVDVILASGERVTASADQYPDLFWAARGGGPLFCGIVTRYHLNIFPRPAAIRASSYVYTIDAMNAVIAWMEKARAKQDPKVELTLIFVTADPAENGGKADKQCIVSAVCFADDEAEAKRLLGAIAEGAPSEGGVFKEELVPKTITELLLSDMGSSPVRQAAETFWTDEVAKAAKLAGQKFLAAPSPDTLVYVNYRSRTTLPADSAYSSIGEAFLASTVAWQDQARDELNFRWSDELVKDLRSIDKAAYINETEFVRHPERASHCFSDANWRRLNAIAAKYDPAGMFASPFMHD